MKKRDERDCSAANARDKSATDLLVERSKLARPRPGKGAEQKAESPRLERRYEPGTTVTVNPNGRESIVAATDTQ
jgi:hypothetical protein